MKKVLFGTVFAVLLVLSFVAGRWHTLRDADKNPPLNPANASEKPKIVPAAMKMEPVDSDDGSPGRIPQAMPPGAVRITPEKQQVIGVRTGVVEKAAVEHFFRAVGKVAPDEKRVYRLVASTDGWIRETYNNDTWVLVKKDERLASFYSPLFRATQINYLSVLGSSPDERYDAGRRQALAPSQLATVSIKTYVDALESLGMSEQQIKELASTRKVTDHVYILAPATGFIIARNVSPGQRFEKGTEWYRIADLSRVWIIGDLFRNEAEYVKPGMKVRMTTLETRKTLNAVVSAVLPQFDANTRTLKVRLEADNPGYILRPDMFVDIHLPIQFPPAITVPAEAILDSGLRKTVFVDRGNGFFEPREVETGWRMGNRVEIAKGLEVGEKIVTSGTFLIDSESKLELVAQGMYTTLSKDPVCGAEVAMRKAEKAGLKASYGGKTYYFHSNECKDQFQKNPSKFLKETAEGTPAERAISPKAPDKQGQDHRHG